MATETLVENHSDIAKTISGIVAKECGGCITTKTTATLAYQD